MENRKLFPTAFEHLVFEDQEIEKIQQLLRDSIDLTDERLFDEGETCGPGKRHDPSEVMQRNAEFLLESSKKIRSYDETTLLRMQQAFDCTNYAQVIDLAYQHDRRRRQGTSRCIFSPNDSRLGRVKQFVANILTILSN
ncbi:MAG: hypothetical protein ACXAC5_11920 [Promethearchaeota archaeon]|jgi:hypothetical protein